MAGIATGAWPRDHLLLGEPNPDHRGHGLCAVWWKGPRICFRRTDMDHCNGSESGALRCRADLSTPHIWRHPIPFSTPQRHCLANGTGNSKRMGAPLGACQPCGDTASERNLVSLVTLGLPYAEFATSPVLGVLPLHIATAIGFIALATTIIKFAYRYRSRPGARRASSLQQRCLSQFEPWR